MASLRDPQGTTKETELEAVRFGVTLPEQFRRMLRLRLAMEQRNDSTLKELFDKVLPFGDISSLAHGVFFS